MVAGVCLLSVTFLASLPFIASHLALAVQLQTSRIFWVIDLFAVLTMTWVLAEARGPSTRVGGGVAPGRSGARRSSLRCCSSPPPREASTAWTSSIRSDSSCRSALEDSDWVRVGRWIATNSAVDSHVLADPDHDWKFGHSVRITARRDVLVEGVKDAALALYDRDVAMRVQARLEAIGDFATLDATSALALARALRPRPARHRPGRRLSSSCTARAASASIGSSDDGSRPCPCSTFPDYVPSRRWRGGHRMTVYAWAKPRPLPTTARARGLLLRHRHRRARARALQLAAAARPGAGAVAAARPRGLEPGALHARHRGQGLGRRLQRRAPQPAQLRRHRAPVTGPVSLRADARSAVPVAAHDRQGRRPRGRAWRATPSAAT